MPIRQNLFPVSYRFPFVTEDETITIFYFMLARLYTRTRYSDLSYYRNVRITKAIVKTPTIDVYTKIVHRFAETDCPWVIKNQWRTSNYVIASFVFGSAHWGCYEIFV